MRCFFLLILSLPLLVVANPFKIEFPAKETLTEKDYEEVQAKLQALDLAPILDAYYPSPAPKRSLFSWSKPLAKKQDFYNRISKSTNQTLINIDKGQIPSQHLVKINKGGDRCVVCYVSFNGVYSRLVKDLSKHLEEVGFDGYLFYMIGGYPNPTGKEIQYCGVPYSFKIFALLEAQKRGFNKVLWIDSSYIPLKSPAPLFEWIEENGCFFKSHDSFNKYILPKTRALIEEITGVDVVKSRYISAQIIGFDLNSPLAHEFISEYYKLVELGLPFLSCFPEEYVFSSITGKHPDKWKTHPFTKLSFAEIKLKNKHSNWAKENDFFFLQTRH